MRRRLLNIFAISSAVLCVVCAVFWIRCFWRSDIVGLFLVPKFGVIATSTNGTIITGLVLVEHRPQIRFGWNSEPRTNDLDAGIEQWCGFAWGKLQTGMGNVYMLGMPFWLLIAISATGAWGLRRLARIADFKQECCQHCGYDLRATPDRCPECGNTQKSRIPD
jgi:hypothetical protein